MKKISILLALTALVLASLACQTLMGGGDVPTIPNDTIPSDSGNTNDSGDPVAVPTVSGSGDNIIIGGDSEFPMTADAFNIISAAGTLTYQTKSSTDDVMKFYRDQFDSKGYKEDPSMTITFGTGFTLVFNGHESGKSIYVVGADAGDGSTYVTITLQ